MQRLQAFKFELMPDDQQARQMRRFAGLCRFVFNKALVMQKTLYEQGEKKLGYAGLCKLLTGWRNSTEMAWLSDVPVHPLQQMLKDLERAYKNFFARRTAFPRFKKKGQSGSFRYPDPKQIKLDQDNTRIANARRDFVHKVTTTISNNHAMVCIEDLQVRNLSRSAAGSTKKPGKNVRAKSGLNKAILDQGWFEFRRQLDYKLAWNGGMLIAVPPQNMSRMCPCCGHVSKDNRQTQAQFRCMECDFEANADVVGAINILARGHRVAACGEPVQSGCSMKQEPAEATIQGLALV